MYLDPASAAAAAGGDRGRSARAVSIFTARLTPPTMPSAPLRPPGTVQHVTVNVSDLEASADFYALLGFDARSAVQTDGLCSSVTLTSASAAALPGIVLQQWAGGLNGSAITEAHEAGLARMALFCGDCHAEVARLRELGWVFLSEPVTDTPPGSIETTIVATLDPDGTM